VAESDAIHAIAPHVTDTRAAIRKGALVGLVKYGGIPGVLTAGERLLKLLDAPAAADRILAADVLGEVAIRDYDQPLLRLLDDPDLSVRRAALAAAATVQSPRLLCRAHLSLERDGQPKAVVAPTGPEPVVQPRAGSNQVRCGAKYSGWAVSAPLRPGSSPFSQAQELEKHSGMWWWLQWVSTRAVA
jgi:hypothetical protein